MNEIILRKFETHDIRMVQDENGELWWIAKDVCSLLDINNVADAMSRLDDDEKLISVLPISGQNREVWLVNEAGLYTLIIRSNKPEAKHFIRWITHEVLPAIRKTGMFIPDRKLTFAFLQLEAESAIKLTHCFGLKGNQALLSANHAIRHLYSIDCLELIGTTHLIADDNEMHMTPSDIGMELGISPVKVNHLLKSIGLQIDHRDHKKRIRWEPTEKGMPYAVSKDTGKRHSDGTPVQQLFWKRSVLDLLKPETKSAA